MSTRTITSAVATLIALAVIGGCEAFGPTATELDHGNSVRHMVQAQTLNPAGSDAAPVDSSDASRTGNALGVYRTDVSLPRYNSSTRAPGSNGSQQQ
jgi:hypothetical protein